MSALIGGIVVGASVAGKLANGISQNSKASNIEKNNIRPTESVDPIYQQNLNTANQMAQTGLPQQQYNNQLNSINRNQASGIQALGQSQNPTGSIASIVRAGNDANNNLNAQDAAARNRNTLLMIQQKGLLANAKQHAFDYNYKDKYSENLAKSQALRGAAAQNINGALDTAGQAAIGYVGANIGAGGNSGYSQSDPALNYAAYQGQQRGLAGINSQEQAFNKYLGQ